MSKSLPFLIDPGTASSEDIAELFMALSDVYRAMGGTGLIFKVIGSSGSVVEVHAMPIEDADRKRNQQG